MEKDAGRQNLQGPHHAYIFRYATLEDLSSLSRLSQLTLEGVDFLAVIFTDLLQRPGWFFFTATEKASQSVVAVTAVHIFDEGKTLTYRFSRIHPEHQNRGLVKAIKQWGLQRIREDQGTAPTLNRSLVLTSYFQTLVKKGIQVHRISSIDIHFVKFDLKPLGKVGEKEQDYRHMTEMIPYPDFLSHPSFCKHKSQILKDGFLSLDGDIFDMNNLSEDDMDIFHTRKLHVILTTDYRAEHGVEGLCHFQCNNNNNNSGDFVATAILLHPNRFDCGLPGFSLNVVAQGRRLLHAHCTSLLKLYESKFGQEGDAVMKVFYTREMRNGIKNQVSNNSILLNNVFEKLGVHCHNIRDNMTSEWIETPVRVC